RAGYRHPLANVHGRADRAPPSLHRGLTMSIQATSRITGATRVLFILADPVTHVRTPQAMNALAELHGTDSVMVPCDIASADLPVMLDAMRVMKSVDGAVVTTPHKLAAAALCDELSVAARSAGVVNAIRRTPEGVL